MEVSRQRIALIALHASIPEKHRQDNSLVIAVNHFINIIGMKDYVGDLSFII